MNEDGLDDLAAVWAATLDRATRDLALTTYLSPGRTTRRKEPVMPTAPPEPMPDPADQRKATRDALAKQNTHLLDLMNRTNADGYQPRPEGNDAA